LRFNAHDVAQLCGFKKAMNVLKGAGYNAQHLLAEADCQKSDILPLPFIFIFGRNQNIVKVQGAPFSVEGVQEYLAHPELIESNTGNFKMGLTEDNGKNEHLCLTIELADGIKTSLMLAQKYKDIFCDTVTVKAFLKLYDGTVSEIAPIINLVERGQVPFPLQEKPKHHYLKRAR
jgi:phenylacetate-coenzyme A ligase PaaK-like adenylate-forming protein